MKETYSIELTFEQLKCLRFALLYFTEMEEYRNGGKTGILQEDCVCARELYEKLIEII